MNVRKAITTFFILMIAGVSAYVFFRDGYYPVAMVNYSLIPAHDLQKDYVSAILYFRNAVTTYGADSKILDDPDARREVKRAALDKIITDKLIYAEAKKRVGDDLEVVIQNVIEKNIDVSKIAEAAEKLYGLTPEDFRARILDAEARKEVLQARMFTDKESFDDWLVSSKNNARVMIFIPGFTWDKKVVISN